MMPLDNCLTCNKFPWVKGKFMRVNFSLFHMTAMTQLNCHTKSHRSLATLNVKEKTKQNKTKATEILMTLSH